MRVHRLVVVLVAAALTASGASARAATPPPGGANQKPSLQGCMNAWLFNGVWRVRATGVEPIEDFGTKGIGVRVEVRNGTHQPLQIGQSGVDGQGAGIELAGADGSALNVDAGAYQTQLGYKTVVQGGAVKTVLRFHFQNPVDAAAFKPVKLVIQFEQKNVHVPGVRYTTSNPSLRIDLTCGAVERLDDFVRADVARGCKALVDRDDSRAGVAGAQLVAQRVQFGEIAFTPSVRARAAARDRARPARAPRSARERRIRCEPKAGFGDREGRVELPLRERLRRERDLRRGELLRTWAEGGGRAV